MLAAFPLAPGDIYLQRHSTALAAVNKSKHVRRLRTHGIDCRSRRTPRKAVRHFAPPRYLASLPLQNDGPHPRGEFEERLRTIKLRSVPTSLPLQRDRTLRIQPAEATDPAYWARHLRGTVRFSDNLAELLRNPGNLLVEVGPGNVLATLARQQGGTATKAWSSLPHRHDATPALRTALTTVGHLWTQGVNFDWSKLNNPTHQCSASRCPTYPFEHTRYWIEPDKASPAISASDCSFKASPQNLSLFIAGSWKPAPGGRCRRSHPILCRLKAHGSIFRDAQGLGDQIANRLKDSKRDVVVVTPGSAYKKNKRGRYTIRAAARARLR